MNDIECFLVLEPMAINKGKFEPFILLVRRSLLTSFQNLYFNPSS